MLSLLRSQVIVNEFLDLFLRALLENHSISTDWCERNLLPQLVQLATNDKTIRTGVTKILAVFAEAFGPKAILPHVSLAFQWAFELRPIALILLNGADSLVTPRTSELFPKFRELLAKVVRTADPRVRSLVPAIMAANPTVFLHDAHGSDQTLVSLLADRSPVVRCAVVEQFTKVRNIDPQNLTAILKALLTFYEDGSPELIERLCSAETYSNLNAGRILSILPAFLSFTETVTSWRHMRGAINAIATFPAEVIQNHWSALARIVFGWTTQYPHALVVPATQFATVVASTLVLFEYDALQECLAVEFVASPNYRARLCVPLLCSAMAEAGGPDFLVDFLFGKLAELSADPVTDVRAAVLRYLDKIRRYYAYRREGVREREVKALFAEIGEREPSVHVRSEWAALEERFAAPVPMPAAVAVHHSFSHASGLPRLITNEPKMPIPVSESEKGQNFITRIRGKGVLGSSSVLGRLQLQHSASSAVGWPGNARFGGSASAMHLGLL
jgi:hypothetical protein